MSRRTQMIVFGVLLVVLMVVVYFFYGRSTDSPQPVSVDAKFTPLEVDNPALRTDILKRFLNLEYKGVHRSIFSASFAASARASSFQSPCERCAACSNGTAAPDC